MSFLKIFKLYCAGNLKPCRAISIKLIGDNRFLERNFEVYGEEAADYDMGGIKYDRDIRDLPRNCDGMRYLD